MTPLSYLAIFLSATFTLLGLVHVYWALGGRRGLQAALPQVPVKPLQPLQPELQRAGEPAQRNAFTPSPASTLAVAAALLGVALAVALRGGLFGEPMWHAALRCVLAAVALALLARAIGDFRLVGFFKRVKNSAFARMDSRVYAPLCVLLGVGMGWMALS
jgi:hypothetical protein